MKVTDIFLLRFFFLVLNQLKTIHACTKELNSRNNWVLNKLNK